MLTAAVTPRRCHEVDPFNAGRRAVGVAFSTDASLRLPIRCFRRRLAPRRPADLGGFGWRYLGSTPPTRLDEIQYCIRWSEVPLWADWNIRVIS